VTCFWKAADPDIPILKQAKAEYAKLQSPVLLAFRSGSPSDSWLPGRAWLGFYNLDMSPPSSTYRLSNSPMSDVGLSDVTDVL